MVKDGRLWLGMISYGYGQLCYGWSVLVKDGQLWLVMVGCG